jgi:hypothetical protein
MVFITYYLYVVENVSAAQTISLFLILGLNIILIYLNYSEHQTFRELIKNKVYVVSNSILILAVILIYNFREFLNLTEVNYHLQSYDFGVIFGLMLSYFVLGKIAQKLI